MFSLTHAVSEHLHDKQNILGEFRSNLKSKENLCEGLHPDQIRGYDHG